MHSCTLTNPVFNKTVFFFYKSHCKYIFLNPSQCADWHNVQLTRLVKTKKKKQCNTRGEIYLAENRLTFNKSSYLWVTFRSCTPTQIPNTYIIISLAVFLFFFFNNLLVWTSRDLAWHMCQLQSNFFFI